MPQINHAGLLVVLVFVAFLLAGCASTANSGGSSNTQGTTDRNGTVAGRTFGEPTTIQGGGDITGFITRFTHTRDGDVVVIEEDPEADCRKARDEYRSPCRRMYLSITKKTHVLRGREGSRASASDLKKGQRVIGMAGNTIADGHGEAVMVVILEPDE